MIDVGFYMDISPYISEAGENVRLFISYQLVLPTLHVIYLQALVPAHARLFTCISVLIFFPACMYILESQRGRIFPACNLINMMYVTFSTH